MNTVKENLLLHPVRLRILLAVAGREVTAQQMADELPDIPQATLYRNINTLTAAGMLKVVRERRVHNTLEKTYALPEQGVMLTPEDLKDATSEDYIRLGAQFLGMLLSHYVRYIQKGSVDLARDNVLFQMVPLYMSHGEAQEIGRALGNLLLPYTKNEPSPERQHLILGLMAVPDAAAAQESMAEDPSAHSRKGEW